MSNEETITDVLTLVNVRNEFYRDGYRRIVLALILALGIFLLLLALLSYKILHPPAPRYFAVDGNGRLTPIIDMNKPNMSDAMLLQWTTQAALASYSYNYVNYRKELQAASTFFTPEGWHKFMSALDRSLNLVAVKDKRMIVTAVPTGSPVLLWKGVTQNDDEEDVYAWRVQLPMKVIYQSNDQTSVQNVVTTVTVFRVNILYSAAGIGIDSIVVADDAGNQSI